MRKKIIVGLSVGLVVGIGVILWQLNKGEYKGVASKGAAAGSSKPRSRAPHTQGALGLDQDMQEPAFAADEDPRGTLRLEGQVLDSEKIAVGGALVTIDSYPKRTAVTEEDGSFAFDNLVGRTYRILARKDDSAGGPVVHQLTSVSNPVVVRLDECASVAVTVVAKATGEPITGAKAELRSREKRLATTDAAGKALFRGVREGNKLFSASAEGYVSATKLLSVPRQTKTPLKLRLALKSGVSISGRVLDEAGMPVIKARVGARDVADLSASLGRDWLDWVETDHNGHFKTPGLTTGTYRLAVEHKDYAPTSSKPMAVGSVAVKDVKITMLAGGLVAGRVLTAQGKGATWAVVRVALGQANVGSRLGKRNRRATADDFGIFKIKGLPRTKVVLAATSETGSSKVVEVDLTAKPKEENLVLKLDLQGIISGVVVDGDGEPVPEVQVSAMPDIFGKGAMRSLFLRGLNGQITDGGGRFAFRGLPDGKYRLRASRTGVSRRMYSMQKGTEARTGDTEVRLTLVGPGGVKGSVQDKRGQPISTFTVTVGEPPGTPVSNKEGKFQVGQIPPGKYTVTVRSPGYAAMEKNSVAISAGEIANVGVITLQRGRSVSGKVVDRNGTPVQGADVVVGQKIIGDGKRLVAKLGQAFEERSGIRRGKTTEDGSFQVMGISATVAQLIIAEHPRHGRSSALAIPQGEEDAQADLQLHPFGSLEGKVFLGKKAVPGVMVVVTQKGSRNQSLLVTTDNEGAYLLERLPAGSYDLMSMSGMGLGGKSGGAKATVEPGKRAQADIRIEAGEITLNVAVLGQGGVKIPLAQVFVFKGAAAPKTGKQVQEAFLGLAKAGGAMMSFVKDGGSAQFKKVAPASYNICVLPINGDIQDPSFRARLQKHSGKLRVHCKPYVVGSSPSEQSFSANVPPMDPLPEEEDKSPDKS